MEDWRHELSIMRSCAPGWLLTVAEDRSERNRPGGRDAAGRTELHARDGPIRPGGDEESLMTDHGRGVRLIASRIRSTSPRSSPSVMKGITVAERTIETDAT